MTHLYLNVHTWILQLYHSFWSLIAHSLPPASHVIFYNTYSFLLWHDPQKQYLMTLSQDQTGDSPNEIGKDKPVDLWEVIDESHCLLGVFVGIDSSLVQGVWDEGFIQLSIPKLEQCGTHVGFTAVTNLPLVHHLLQLVYLPRGMTQQSPLVNLMTVSAILRSIQTSLNHDFRYQEAWNESSKVVHTILVFRKILVSLFFCPLLSPPPHNIIPCSEHWLENNK